MILTYSKALVSLIVDKWTSCLVVEDSKIWFLCLDFHSWLQEQARHKMSLFGLKFFYFNDRWFYYSYKPIAKNSPMSRLGIYTLGSCPEVLKQLVEEFSPDIMVTIDNNDFIVFPKHSHKRFKPVNV